MFIYSCCLYLTRVVPRWYRYYIYFSKASSFLFGLILAHGLVKNAVVDALMLYLVEGWKNPNLMKAAAIVVIEEVISGVIALVIAILTEVWVGRFKMVLFTTASFILGLLLLSLSTLHNLTMRNPIVYVALFLIAFGKAGKDPPFKNFIGDQLSGNDTEQVEDRTTFWWRAFRFCGAAISVFVLTSKTWKEIFLVCAAVMGAAYLIFLLGICFRYNYTLPPGRYPFFVLGKVLKAAIAKRSLNYPRTPTGYFLNQGNELPICPCDPFLRCIDKAAIVEQASTRLQVEAELQEQNLCTVEEVKQAKSLLRLAPSWFAFSLYGLVTAAGNTFFIEQSSGLKEYYIGNFRFPINLFFIWRSLVSFIASYLANLLLSRYCNTNYIWKLKGTLIKVGAGIVVSAICCQVASQVEHARLDLVRIHGDPDTQDVILPMTILWLTPQYTLLGLMDGLSQDGLSELFYIFVHESMEGIETSINQLMMGIVKLPSIGFAFVSRGWFGDSINTSQLDKYFFMLFCLSWKCCALCPNRVLLCIHSEKRNAV